MHQLLLLLQHCVEPGHGKLVLVVGAVTLALQLLADTDLRLQGHPELVHLVLGFGLLRFRARGLF